MWSEALKLDVYPRTPGRGQCGNIRTWPEDEAARVEEVGKTLRQTLSEETGECRTNVRQDSDCRDVVAKRALHSTTTKSRGSGDCFRLIDDEDVVTGRPARGVAGTCIQGRFGAKDDQFLKYLDVRVERWSNDEYLLIQFCRCGLRRAGT